MTDENKKCAEFASELTALCCKHGFGFAEDVAIFVMERDDYLFGYEVNTDGNLVRK